MNHGPAKEDGATRIFERTIYHGSLLLVGASGAIYAWMKYAMGPPEDPFSVINHPLQPRMLHVHILAAPLLILALGMITRHHILPRLRRRNGRRGRWSGVLSATLAVPLVASGYLLQTVISEDWRRTLVWIHVVSGGVFLLTYFGHFLGARIAAVRRSARHEERAFEPGDLHLRSGEIVKAFRTRDTSP